MYSTTAVINPEVCVNLWAYLDEQTGYIPRVSGRGYVMTGTDNDKLATLHTLAKTDFLIAPWLPIPKNVKVVTENGTLNGMTTPAVLNDSASFNAIFEQVFRQIDRTIPKQLKFNGSDYEEFCLKIPNEPLYVLTTVIEYDDGRLEPIISTR